MSSSTDKAFRRLCQGPATSHELAKAAGVKSATGIMAKMYKGDVPIVKARGNKNATVYFIKGQATEREVGAAINKQAGVDLGHRPVLETLHRPAPTSLFGNPYHEEPAHQSQMRQECYRDYVETPVVTKKEFNSAFIGLLAIRQDIHIRNGQRLRAARERFEWASYEPAPE